MLAKILAVRHGFKCTVLFAINPAFGTIRPDYQNNVPGTHLLDDADMMVLFTRFRELPDEQMKPIVDFANSGKADARPTHGNARIQLRGPNQTAHMPGTHSRVPTPKGGFGQLVLGDTWISHHGDHGDESTRGIINEAHGSHPILSAGSRMSGDPPTYTASCICPRTQRCLMFGQVLSGMEPDFTAGGG